MNCTTARRLMLLARPGERSDRETHDLEHHLAECPACRKEQSAIGATVAGFRRIAGAEPVVPDRSIAAQEVIRRLRQSSPSASPIADALFRPAEAPAVRFALIAGVLIAATMFGFEVSTTLWDMHRLEMRFADRRPVSSAPSVFGGNPADMPLTAARKESLRSLGYSRASSERLIASAGIDRIFRPFLSGESVDAAVRGILGDTPEARTVLQMLRAHPAAASRLFGKGE